ncbi:hypothetical protein PtrM4_099010 [Pyrenophora tritici-repentis]|uniref:Uncharacterized protein n=1 Tax=Pyrenophora tritici-repentis TaxID=45151 RepID=A0A834RYY2_9PLEO|nr:hypothetical protein PtrM4_099010 [Pyrenophora tritici-repentis]KAI1670677.1 hypothetical protein L13192_06193 [Pyrenophora tritici-repentis]
MFYKQLVIFLVTMTSFSMALPTAANSPDIAVEAAASYKARDSKPQGAEDEKWAVVIY